MVKAVSACVASERGGASSTAVPSARHPLAQLSNTATSSPPPVVGARMLQFLVAR